MLKRPVTVIKKNIQNEETWRYPGTVLHQDSTKTTLEAYFNRPDMAFHGILLCQGDRFIETFFAYRWYNIFTIYDRKTSERKGWYCNLSYPATIDDDEVSYVDLALDLLVFPDGRQIKLDQDEYESLNISEQDRKHADLSFRELRDLFERAFKEVIN
jgi:uncharacterized protein